MIDVSAEFIESFNLCMDYYECTDEEIDYEKKRVRKNYEEAYECYMAIAEEIKVITHTQG